MIIMNELSQTELYIMNVIWDLCEEKQPISTDEIAEKVRKDNWDRPALLGFLKKLAKKGFVDVEKNESDLRQNLYTILISREEYSRNISKWLISHLHKGSMKSYFASLAVDDKNLEEILRGIREKEDK